MRIAGFLRCVVVGVCLLPLPAWGTGLDEPAAKSSSSMDEAAEAPLYRSLETQKPQEDPIPPSENEPSGKIEENGKRADVIKKKVLAPLFQKKSELITADELDTITALVFFHLSQHPDLQVISGSDLAAMLDMEAEKQLLGCEGESCLEEIAGALDTDILVTGNVGRLGNRFVVNLTLIDARQAKTINRVSVKARTQGELPFQLRQGVHRLLIDFGGLPGGGEEESRTSFARSVQDFATQPDMIMLLALLGISFSGIALPLCFVFPLFQSAILWGLGEMLAGRDYPLWWTAPLVGYPVLLLGLSGVVLFYWLAELQESSPWFGGMISRELRFTATAGFFVTVFILEPLAVWVFGTLNAKDVQTVDSDLEQNNAFSPKRKGTPSAFFSGLLPGMLRVEE